MFNARDAFADGVMEVTVHAFTKVFTGIYYFVTGLINILVSSPFNLALLLWYGPRHLAERLNLIRVQNGPTLNDKIFKVWQNNSVLGGLNWFLDKYVKAFLMYVIGIPIMVPGTLIAMVLRGSAWFTFDFWKLLPAKINPLDAMISQAINAQNFELYLYLTSNSGMYPIVKRYLDRIDPVDRHDLALLLKSRDNVNLHEQAKDLLSQYPEFVVYAQELHLPPDRANKYNYLNFSVFKNAFQLAKLTEIDANKNLGKLIPAAFLKNEAPQTPTALDRSILTLITVMSISDPDAFTVGLAIKEVINQRSKEIERKLPLMFMIGPGLADELFKINLNTLDDYNTPFKIAACVLAANGYWKNAKDFFYDQSGEFINEHVAWRIQENVTKQHLEVNSLIEYVDKTLCPKEKLYSDSSANESVKALLTTFKTIEMNRQNILNYGLIPSDIIPQPTKEANQNSLKRK